MSDKEAKERNEGRKRSNDNLCVDQAESPDSSKARKNKKVRKPRKIDVSKEPTLVVCLLRLDPILQFLTKATGTPFVPLKTVKSSFPILDDETLVSVKELTERGILQINGAALSDLTWSDENILIGFPSPPSLDNAQSNTVNQNGTLHGSTKSAAKRRLAALKRSLKLRPGASTMSEQTVEQNVVKMVAPAKNWCVPPDLGEDSEQEEEVFLDEEKEARNDLDKTFGFSGGKVGALKKSLDQRISGIIPRQVAYAGSHSKRNPVYSKILGDNDIPSILWDSFDIETQGPSPTIKTRRKLYSHQAAAIDSAMNDIHTLVCTGTGSGKSLCFLIPVLAACLQTETSLILFPTKALAQDQYTKLVSMIESHAGLKDKIFPGIIDGDVSQAQRRQNAKKCNIILTNPDTLHAAILPGWKSAYKELLGRIKYVVIDEAHMYEGVFGAHVSMVLSRFLRLSAVCSQKIGSDIRSPVFLACSATMSHPEQHFRLLCPITDESKITILHPSDDGSPRAAKHFFVWNPPIMNIDGTSTGRVTISNTRKNRKDDDGRQTLFLGTQCQAVEDKTVFRESDTLQLADTDLVSDLKFQSKPESDQKTMKLYRRHAADETALLLARAISQGVRCIAFCKTRCLVEWVYERAISALKGDSSTQHLTNQLEVYRGGYTTKVRRSIENRLFKNDLLGVVGTNALELGVDIGGIDLTLHCGYPTSYSSLLQQAGRAGRGSERLDTPSLSIMVCFSSPSEQHIWRNPTSLMSRGRSGLVSMPVNVGLVQGHLLCAGNEYPITGQHPVCALFSDKRDAIARTLNDYDLFGSATIVKKSINALIFTGLMTTTTIPVSSSTLPTNEMMVYKTHPFVDKPWTRVNLRSIEPINYAIVDLSHPLQGGAMDGVHDEQAILDNIPYSRVFYHAFPGAIITHRGRRYKVQSMTRPPAFADSAIGYKGGTLAAYAKPTTARYLTRPLSTLKITVVKQMERIDDFGVDQKHDESDKNLDVYTDPDAVLEREIIQGSLAGNGVINVIRSVHGYKKISLITREELSRTELSLPAMEFDTFAFWLDTEASVLRSIVKDYDEGVHALSHAILAVAPLFVPSGSSDLNCDHNVHDCTRVVIFDVRAGGSGTCAELFKSIFLPDGLLHCAVDMMQNCSQCKGDFGYEGGCPSCLHFGQCLKFNQDLNRSAAIHIGQRLLTRIESTDLYKENKIKQDEVYEGYCRPRHDDHNHAFSPLSPRQEARCSALRNAQEVNPTKGRQIILGRPSWPTDPENGSGGKQVQDE